MIFVFFPPSAYPQLTKPEYLRAFAKETHYKLPMDQCLLMQGLIRSVHEASTSFHELNQLLFSNDSPDLKKIEELLGTLSAQIYDTQQTIDIKSKRELFNRWQAFKNDCPQHSKFAETIRIIHDLLLISLGLANIAIGIALTVGVSLATGPVGIGLVGAAAMIATIIMAGVCVTALYAHSVKTNIRFAQDKQFQEIDAAIDLICGFETPSRDVELEEELVKTELRK